MEYITLRNCGIRVSRFCMGGCPTGGYGWGDVRESELISAIHQALDAGINFFDTADTYGLGQSERTLAKGLSARRQDVVIESKFGVRVDGKETFYDNSPAYIQQSLEESLKRLDTHYIDIYLIHYRDKRTPIEDVVETLLNLQRDGKIRYFGLSNVHGNDLDELLPYRGLFVNCQNEFSLACRKYEGDLRRLQDQLLVTPMTWGSLGQGILTGKYDKSSTFGKDDRRSRDIYVNFHGEKLNQNLRIVEVLREISMERKVSIPACAIRFILDFFPQSVVLAGVKRPEQLISNIEAMDWHLTVEEMKRLEEASK